MGDKNENENHDGKGNAGYDETNAGKENDVAEKEAHEVILQRIEAKKKELEEVEQRVAKRNDEYKKLLEETKLEGRSVKAREETDEEKAKKDAIKLIAGTGLEKRLML